MLIWETRYDVTKANDKDILSIGRLRVVWWGWKYSTLGFWKDEIEIGPISFEWYLK